METVEVVIRLPKDEYEEIKETNTIKEHLNKIDWAVRNGTLLPKGHDDLIERAQVTNYDNLYDVPSVIEADREVDNG